MNASTDSSTKTNTIFTENNKVEEEIKGSMDNSEDQLISTKESKFNELIEMLQKWGYKVVNKTKENKIKDIQFKAEISPLVSYSSGTNTPFFLEFQNDLDDGFIIRTTFELDKNIELHLKNQNRAREIELTYIQIEQRSLLFIYPFQDIMHSIYCKIFEQKEIFSIPLSLSYIKSTTKITD